MQRFVLITATLALCWLGMQIVHECGHVVGAYATGGSVARVVLHPLGLSRTDLADNPHPLIVVWCGPLWGVGLPALLYGAAWAIGHASSYLWRFFAGFCLVANGAYIGAGLSYGETDAGEMVRYGSRVWLPLVFAIAAVAMGLFLWNGLGKYFGLTADRRPVSRSATVAVVLLLGLTVVCELLLSAG